MARIAYSTATPSRTNNREQAARMAAAARRQREREAAARKRAAHPAVIAWNDHMNECLTWHGCWTCAALTEALDAV